MLRPHGPREHIFESLHLRTRGQPTAAERIHNSCFFLGAQSRFAQRHEARSNGFASLINRCGTKTFHPVHIEVVLGEGVNRSIFKEVLDFIDPLVNPMSTGESQSLGNLCKTNAVIAKIVVIFRDFYIYTAESLPNKAGKIQHLDVLRIRSDVEHFARDILLWGAAEQQ